MRERVASRAQKKEPITTQDRAITLSASVCAYVCVFPVTEGYWTGPTCQIITTGQRLLHCFWSGRADLAFVELLRGSGKLGSTTFFRCYSNSEHQEGVTFIIRLFFFFFAFH